jgi:hypothetical protein
LSCDRDESFCIGPSHRFHQKCEWNLHLDG